MKLSAADAHFFFAPKFLCPQFSFSIFLPMKLHNCSLSLSLSCRMRKYIRFRIFTFKQRIKYYTKEKVYIYISKALQRKRVS